MATVQGMKLGNPSLKVICFGGDGDSYGEGLAHMIFAAKRNMDITVIVHNNGAYALTTGQFSPTSVEGFKGPSSPEGSIEKPLNPLALLLEAGASFIARGYSAELNHLSDLIMQGVIHEGFSIIDILQPSVVFNDTYAEYNKLTKKVDKTPDTYEEAMNLIKTMNPSIPIGVLYNMKKPVYHKRLYGTWNPVENQDNKTNRLKKIKEFISD
jgi:2-oxoglutarate ferredoxin oxidoreductase subunit beta